MIKLAETSIAIAGPTTTVFVYVSNMENYQHWFPGVVHIKSVNNLNHGEIGKKYVEVLSLPDGDSELEIEVKQCDSNRLFLTQGNLIGVLPQMKITFSTDNAESCVMNLQYHARSLELTPSSEIIIALRDDLAVRANLGLRKLKEIMEINTP